MNSTTFDRERLGRIAFDAMNDYERALGGSGDAAWEAETERNREGLRRIAEAVARAVQPAGVRYRRVALKGHTSLGVCRIEDVEVGGVPMLRATTLCDATPRVEEFPGTSVHSLGVLTAEEAMDAAQKAATARAEQARRDAEWAAQDAREQEARRVARASATVSVTVVGEHVVLLPTVDGVRRPDLLRRDDPEVTQGLRAAVSDLYNARIFYDTDDRTAGLEVTHEADRVDALVAMLHALGFGTVTRLPDQPARTEGADVPF